MVVSRLLIVQNQNMIDRLPGRSPNFPAEQPKPKPAANATIDLCHLLAAQNRALQAVIDREQAKAQEMSEFMAKAYGVTPTAKAAAATTNEPQSVVFKDRSEEQLTDRLKSTFKRKFGG